MVIPNVNQWLDNWGYDTKAFLLHAINHIHAYVKSLVSDTGRTQLRLRSQRDGRRVKDTPQSWSQPAETDHPRMDPGLCAPELSGTVGPFKSRENNTTIKRQRGKKGGIITISNQGHVCKE